MGRAREARGEPVWRMLGYRIAIRKPYASVLFGDSRRSRSPRAKEMRARNFIAAKFGWGPIGRTDARADAEHSRPRAKGWAGRHRCSSTPDRFHR